MNCIWVGEKNLIKDYFYEFCFLLNEEFTNFPNLYLKFAPVAEENCFKKTNFCFTYLLRNYLQKFIKNPKLSTEYVSLQKPVFGQGKRT